ncbi:molybdopterin biosynthesis protein [Thermoflexus sp.]|uniref:molybdopterin biosynthesis protein n=1 Tax=Thermoflexus sp. TaxID=1969742 RepID=UPI0035E466E0
MGRRIYLEDIPLEEAWARFLQALGEAGLDGPFSGERVPLDQALGRITAEPIWARLSVPPYPAAAMDGFALRAQDTIGATETQPRVLPVHPADAGEGACYVDTGDPLPPWADAVVPVEQVQFDAEAPERATQIILYQPVAPWANVRPVAEDIAAAELVLPANHRLRPVDLGVIAACGYADVWVRRQPRVAILPTGTELIPPEHAAAQGVRLGEIIEFNSLMLSAQIREWGGLPTRFPIIPDDFDRLLEATREAARTHDLVLINAGSSAGREDFTARVVSTLGTLLVHGVAVRPGHPVILGMLQVDGRSIPVIGVPGFPVSAALTGEIFVEPLLARWLGRPPSRRPRLSAVLTRKLLSPLGDEEWVRVTVGRVGERYVAAPLPRGAGVLSSLVRADGILRIPRFVEGYDQGQVVSIELYTPIEEIEGTVLAIGSHDMALDLMAQFLAERYPGRRLQSANAGSLGGLIALRRGECHLAGSHLLDPESGEYNLPYVRRYLAGIPVAVVTLAHREQGLIVARGNPKGIRDLQDLARPDVRFVNRQRGAGTRILLDYHLQRLGIDPRAIVGYEREELTHLAVAAAVASGRADVGLGIRAAAAALGLEFIPLALERYDLVIPLALYEDPWFQPVLELLHEARFQAAVAALPGYDVREMGREVARFAGS